MTNVAVLGTGIMGTGMAHSLIRGGHQVTVWNRNPERARLVGEGTRAVDTATDAVRDAEVVITMLTDGGVTADVANSFLGSMKSSAVWVQSATVGVEGARKLSAMAGKANVAYVEAPVLGTKQPAEKGELQVIAAGAEAQRSLVGPVFDSIGSKTIWTGEDPVQAQALKVVANNWITTLTAGLAETLTLAEGLDVDPRQFLSLIEGGPLDSGYAQLKGTAMIDRSYETSFSVALAQKDTKLVESAAAGVGIDLPMSHAVAELYQQAAQTEGQSDMSAVIETVRKKG